MNIRTNKVSNDQQGLVAIVVTLIIMLVLTLIVTGFAQLARREQREALDRQLASQALYAAESGINAAEAAVKAELATGNVDNYTDCGDFENVSGRPALGDITNDNERPTCILVRKDVNELKYQNVQTNKSTIVPIDQQGPGVLDDLTISWENADGANNILSQTVSGNLVTGNPFRPATAWNLPSQNVGVMRIDLVPVNNLNSTALRNGMFTAFLIPTGSGSGVVGYSTGSTPANQGIKVAADCSSASRKRCAVRITGLNVPGQDQYYLRMKSIYNVSDVVVCPSQGFGCDSAVTLVGAQAEIDVTAKAADVLKRVQVRVNTDPNASGSFTIPEYTLDSAESLCKKLEVTPTTTIDNCP